MSAPTYTKTFPVSWHELHRDAKALAWRLVALNPWRGVVAVTRGGLVPAAIVARELDLHVVDTVCVSTYQRTSPTGDERARGEARVLKTIAATAGDERGRWLIVDDLVDTGVTARIVRELLPGAHFATVYAKPAGKPLVDTYVTEVSQDTWIMFPWDTEPQFAPPLAAQGRA